MFLRTRTVPRPSGRRPLTEPLARPATCHLARTGYALLLSVLLVLPGGSFGEPTATPDDPGPSSAALAVSVSDTPDAVHLRIQASGDIEPGSIEVRFAGRKAVVLARDPEGRLIRSQPVRLPAPVVEDGASADYDAEDALVMTLRKQAPAQAAVPLGDPEAAAR
jgi:hypothetical protein